MSKRFSMLVLPVLLLSCPSLYAQVGPPASPAQLPILQGPPGARALGIGGAFIGVSDDATAAEANPAGLTILSRPEISLHVRSQRFALIEDCAPTDTCERDSSTYPAFASFVYPWRNAVFSAYYSSTLDLSTRNAIRFAEFGDPISTFSLDGDASIRRLGVAAAFRPTPLFSIGGAVGVTRLEFQTRETFLIDIGRFFPDLSDPGISFAEFDDRFDGEDTQLSYNLGVLINPGGRFSAGAIYKAEDDLEVDLESQGRFCFGCTIEQLRAGSFEPLEGGVFPVSVPDLYGAGIAIRPFTRSLIAVDYTVQDSDRFEFDDAGNTIRVGQEIRTLRVGAEYLISMNNVLIPLRVGYIREEDPDFENSGFLSDEEDAFTLGTGIVFGNSQIDIGFSSGRTVTTGTKVRQFVIAGTRRF